MDYGKRVQKIKERIHNDGIEGFIITLGTDIRYVSGFTGEAGVAVIILTDKKDYFVTDGRFTSQASQETKGYEVVQWSREKGMYGTVADILSELNLKVVCVDMSQISHMNYLKLAENYKGEIKDSGSYIADERRVKDEEEIALIRKACHITEQSFIALLNQIKEGQSEKEIRNILEYEFRKRGSIDVAFDTIVASGPINGGNPHASLTDRKIQKGDMITIDCGCKYDAYCSDITRTFSLGKPTDEMLHIYETVKKSKENAEAILKAGVMAKDVDYAIRSTIENAGYNLPHGPGHSFGLDIHEAPFLGPNNDYKLEKNVVHTIEPGIYIPGICGVRIEDDYLITENGVECLTPNITRELIIL